MTTFLSDLIGYRTTAIENIIDYMIEHPSCLLTDACQACQFSISDLTKSDIEYIKNEI